MTQVPTRIDCEIFAPTNSAGRTETRAARDERVLEGDAEGAQVLRGLLFGVPLSLLLWGGLWIGIATLR